MIPEEVLQSLSDYCLNKCSTICCDLSRLPLSMTTEEATVVLDEGKDEFEIDDNEYWFDSGLCPRYNPKTKRCSIYDNIDKPEACKDYPFLCFDGILWMRCSCEFTSNGGYEELKKLVTGKISVEEFYDD